MERLDKMIPNQDQTSLRGTKPNGGGEEEKETVEKEDG